MTASTIHDIQVNEIDRLRSFIDRCTTRISENQAIAATQTRPHLAGVYTEIADTWAGQRQDLERRLADLTRKTGL